MAPQSGQYQGAASLCEVYLLNWIPACAGMMRQRGVSLIELIMFIVIVSIALAGITLVMNQTTGHSADTLLRKQALASAESLLEEIEAHAVSSVNPCIGVAGSARTGFNKVCDYNGYATSGVLDMAGSPVSGLGNYNVAVVVASSVFGNIPAASAAQITVTVTPPAGSGISATGYRTNY